jgi:hypothetical protein
MSMTNLDIGICALTLLILTIVLLYGGYYV